jgi:hypothetical protein
MRIAKVVERWFEVDGDEDGARIKIRNLTPGEKADIYDKVFVQQISYKKEKDGKLTPEFNQETDKLLDRELTIKKSIVDWENFFDQDGKELKCTPANMIKALNEIEGFNVLISELREKLSKEIEKEKEGQRKNLPGSASARKK